MPDDFKISEGPFNLHQSYFTRPQSYFTRPQFYFTRPQFFFPSTYRVRTFDFNKLIAEGTEEECFSE